MLANDEPSYQVHLEESVPLVFLGLVAGVIAGRGVAQACARWPRLVRPLGLASVALLGTAVAAPLGWIGGTLVASERLPRVEERADVEHLPPLGMALGAGLGCGLGRALGGVQVLLDRRRSSAGRDGV